VPAVHAAAAAPDLPRWPGFERRPLLPVGTDLERSPLRPGGRDLPDRHTRSAAPLLLGRSAQAVPARHPRPAASLLLGRSTQALPARHHRAVAELQADHRRQMPERHVRLAAQLQAAHPDRVPGRLGGQAAELSHGPGAAAASDVYSRHGDYSRQGAATPDDEIPSLECGRTSTTRGGGNASPSIIEPPPSRVRPICGAPDRSKQCCRNSKRPGSSCAN